MEDFIVSARKYRPSTFQSVVGQHSITTTLKNAIKSNHLAQAYLFCGPRGVGKTTCARIFAKTINCSNLNDEIEPCNECESCKSFNSSRSFNIHELDAASNNSVEDIRNLIDQVRIPPQVGKYSTYIIDEVHMLSQQAFNAFLKTLEEPPKHAIFILATTEKHKIIPTILSRCQIFDFNRIKIEDTVQYLEYISKNEEIEYERDAFNIIAQKADGAMRDALSIFDQVVSFSGSMITYQNVIENLNILDYEYYFNLTDAFLNQDISNALLIFNEILDKGFDAHNFINGLSEHFRNLLVCKDEITLTLLEVGDTIKEKYKLQTGKCSAEFLFDALKISNSCDVSYRMSRNKRLHVELTLVELANILAEKKKPELEEKQTELPKKDTPEKKKEKPKNSDDTVKEPSKLPEEKIATPHSGVVKSISIKDLTSKKVVQEEEPEYESESKREEETTNLREHQFTIEELIDAWNKFAKGITHRPRIYNTLVSKLPELDENHIITFVIDNALQESKFSEIKLELVKFLKEELSNDGLKIELIMSEGVDEGNKLYTAEDKFRHMAEKNENLTKFKQEFNLDFE